MKATNHQILTHKNKVDKDFMSVIKMMFCRAVRHNICISDAQYYESGALQNLWCEILEF